MNTTNEILVFCDSGSDKHGVKHQTPAVQGFVFRSGMADQMGQGWTDVNRSKRLQKVQAHLDAASALVGNERFSREKHRGQTHRESWKLECKKCGDNVLVRHEKLYPALSKMRELGISSIGLSHFREGTRATG